MRTVSDCGGSRSSGSCVSAGVEQVRQEGSNSETGSRRGRDPLCGRAHSADRWKDGRPTGPRLLRHTCESPTGRSFRQPQRSRRSSVFVWKQLARHSLQEPELLGFLDHHFWHDLLGRRLETDRFLEQQHRVNDQLLRWGDNTFLQLIELRGIAPAPQRQLVQPVLDEQPDLLRSLWLKQRPHRIDRGGAIHNRESGRWLTDPSKSHAGAQTGSVSSGSYFSSSDDFAAFYDANVMELLGWFRRKVGDAQVSADLCAESFSVALDRVGTYDSALGSPRQWLYGIARNQLINYWRDLRVSQEYRDRLAIEAVEVDYETVDFLERIEIDDMRLVLAECLSELNGTTRRAVELRLTEGLSYADIATRIDSTELATRQRVFRGIEQLRGCIQ